MKTDTTAAVPSAVDTRTDAERAQDEANAAAARDQAGAQLTKVASEGDIVAGTTVLTPTGTPELEGDAKDWSKVVVVADAPERLPAHKGAKVIIAERRTQPDEKGEGGGLFDQDADYSGNGDAYVGYARSNEPGEAEAIFPNAKAPVFLMGQNVKQFGIGGLSRQSGFLSVGPAHPVYIAVNLAHQKGAKEIQVTGLTDHDKSVLGPWLDKIAGEFESLTY